MPDIEPVADGGAIPGWAPVIEDPAMAALLRPGAVLHRLATGATWAEGPVWMPHDGSVLWSDVVGDRVLRWDPDGRASVFLDDAEFENGHTLDHDGSVVACSHGHRRLERLGLDGTLTPIVDRYLGRRFNSPNDVVVKSDGTIGSRIRPTASRATARATRRTRRSGTASCSGSIPDRRARRRHRLGRRAERPRVLARRDVLYVSDTSYASHDDGGGNHHIAAFDVVGGRTPREPARVLCRRCLGAGRLPRGRRGQRLDIGRRRDPRRRPGRAAPRPAAGPGADGELRLRRPRAGSPVHHRVDVALRDRRGNSRRRAGGRGNRPASRGQAAASNSGHVTRPNARSRAPKDRTARPGPGLRSGASVASETSRRRAGRGGSRASTASGPDDSRARANRSWPACSPGTWRDRAAATPGVLRWSDRHARCAGDARCEAGSGARGTPDGRRATRGRSSASATAGGARGPFGGAVAGGGLRHRSRARLPEPNANRRLDRSLSSPP